MPLETRHFNDALMSQSAVNVSGLVRSLAEIMPLIWEAARELGMGKGTDWVNHHPITQLFAYQIAYLAHGRENMEWDDYSRASGFCKGVADGKCMPNADYQTINEGSN